MVYGPQLDKHWAQGGQEGKLRLPQPSHPPHNWNRLYIHHLSYLPRKYLGLPLGPKLIPLAHPAL